jgi:hypothetical protein
LIKIIVCPFPVEVKGVVLGDAVILVDPKYLQECCNAIKENQIILSK